MKIQIVLRRLIFVLALFLFTQCSNSGNKKVGAACRNQCLVQQSLCYLVTNPNNSVRSFQPNVGCQFLFVSCLADCDSGRGTVSRTRSSSRSSGSGGRGSSSSGGGSGGGSSGGGSSGGGHGGGGH